MSTVTPWGSGKMPFRCVRPAVRAAGGRLPGRPDVPTRMLLGTSSVGGVVLVPEQIIIDWTLVDDDWRLVGAKRGAARLGFALLMRYFRLHGRFPRSRRDLPTAAVGYVARQLRVA